MSSTSIQVVLEKFLVRLDVLEENVTREGGNEVLAVFLVSFLGIKT